MPDTFGTRELTPNKGHDNTLFIQHSRDVFAD